ncbi:MAG: M28 family metallopeptidase [Myxococcota bacterium]
MRVPTPQAIFDWIRLIYEQGIRRPGTPADRWTIEFCENFLLDLGVEKVRLEPVPLAAWEPSSWALRVRDPEGERPVRCFPLPYSAPTREIELDLVAYDPRAPERVAGAASLHDVRLLELPAQAPVALGRAAAPGLSDLSIEIHAGGRVVDPRGSLEATRQRLPFGPEIQQVMEPAIAAGAAAYVGSLVDYPGDSCEYYVPYDGIARPIPGLWIPGSEGARLRAALARAPVRVELRVDSRRSPITSHNVVGELAGADDETVVIGSHHDGPWSSAVEDASGVALVLAQAAYWSSLPRRERPHRLVFVIQAGHMAGGAGCRAFLEAHARELDRIVLEVHLEHAASEWVEQAGHWLPSGEPEPRWFFSSRNPQLEAAVLDALTREGLDRSLILPPDVFGDQPTSDGGPFHLAGVPLVQYLTAPFYLFDRSDTLERVHVPSLVPVTRAAIRIIQSTAGVSAATMRAGVIDVGAAR